MTNFNRQNKYTCIEESTANYIWGRKPKDFYTSARNAQLVSSKSVALLSSGQYIKMRSHCLLRLDDNKLYGGFTAIEDFYIGGRLPESMYIEGQQPKDL